MVVVPDGTKNLVTMESALLPPPPDVEELNEALVVDVNGAVDVVDVAPVVLAIIKKPTP